MTRQTTSHILMIRPAAFGFNLETAQNNTFQHRSELKPENIQESALKEFDRLVELLEDEGVDVTVIQDTRVPVKPDALFPNNWVSFHNDGTLITYPMFSPLRRQERRKEILRQIGENYKIVRRIEMEDSERKSMFLEGTGSMVLDRVNKVAYACISPRTDQALLYEWCATMGYKPCIFHAEFEGKPIYHTNVMMAIGDGIAVVSLDVVAPEEREKLSEQLAISGRDVVNLREDQIGSFAGNMLAVRNKKGEQLMVMSATAYQSLDQKQKETIGRHARIVHSDIPTIESVGGGSVRCMIAENFLPHI